MALALSTRIHERLKKAKHPDAFGSFVLAPACFSKCLFSDNSGSTFRDRPLIGVRKRLLGPIASVQLPACISWKSLCLCCQGRSLFEDVGLRGDRPAISRSSSKACGLSALNLVDLAHVCVPVFLLQNCGLEPRHTSCLRVGSWLEEGDASRAPRQIYQQCSSLVPCHSLCGLCRLRLRHDIWGGKWCLVPFPTPRTLHVMESRRWLKGTNFMRVVYLFTDQDS